MHGGSFYRIGDDKNPLSTSWLNALSNTRARTQAVLNGINPWDAVVQHMRDQHHLLIGNGSAEKMQIEANYTKTDHLITVLGRNLLNGLPTRMEIPSPEIRAIDNSATAQPYIDWKAENGRSIGELLYQLAVNEVNWLFGCIVEEPPADYDKIMALFEQNPENVIRFVHGQTLAQHYDRLWRARDHLTHAFRAMTVKEFQHIRMQAGSSCTPEWLAHELCQYEAERRVEIAQTLAQARQAIDRV